ncbi:hypothetical protein ACTFIU_009584 [Dictyostelium citrinum]
MSYPNQQQQSGYPQQNQSGYPQQQQQQHQQQQQGYPQQGYPQQSYPQQGYPQQNQGGYSQQNQGGYPQQPQQQNNNPQQNQGGYPIQQQQPQQYNPYIQQTSPPITNNASSAPPISSVPPTSNPAPPLNPSVQQTSAPPMTNNTGVYSQSPTTTQQQSPTTQQQSPSKSQPTNNNNMGGYPQQPPSQQQPQQPQQQQQQQQPQQQPPQQYQSSYNQQTTGNSGYPQQLSPTQPPMTNNTSAPPTGYSQSAPPMTNNIGYPQTTNTSQPPPINNYQQYSPNQPSTSNMYQQQSQQPQQPQPQQYQYNQQPQQQQQQQQQQWNSNPVPSLQNLSLGSNNQQPPQQYGQQPSQQQQQYGQPPQQYGQPPFVGQQQQTWQPQQQTNQQQIEDNRINMSKVPSPTAILEQFNNYIYKTNSDVSPPPSTVQQLVIDQQNASPNFIRSTLYTIPENEDTLNLIHIPFAIHVQPLAYNGIAGEVPVIRTPGGPVQCKRCHSYINPFNAFTNGGKYFTCRFCEFENQVPQEYFSATLPNGQRTDYEQRPELQRGSYDFIKTEANPAQVPGYVFVIEISQVTINSGIVENIINAIKRILNERYDSVPAKVGIITYDTEVHFWSFKPTYAYPQMKVLTADNVFVPVNDGFLVDYRESKQLMDFFFENFKTFFKRPQPSNQPFAFGAAVQAATMSLEKIGGRVFSFNTTLPKGSPGAIAKRVERSIQPSPNGSQFYKMVATECVAKNVSVDLFVIPTEICDVPSYAQLATTTGGHINLYNNYSAEVHSELLTSDIIHYVTMEFGFNATSKVRSSRGITVSAHYGNITEDNGLIQMAGVTSDKSITTVLKYDDKLKPKSKAYIQFAMIYTNIKGETRIRIHNLRLSVDSVLTNLFKDSDLDSITTYFARVASKEVLTTTPTTVRSNTVDKGVDLLASYRKNCASDKKATQLILPEGIKLMPIYILSMMKTPCFRLSPDISQDLRYFYLNLYASSAPSRIIPLIYPRTYPIHNLLPGDGYKHPNYDHIVLPSFIRLSADQISQNGIYIHEDGRQIMVWIQQFAATNYLRDLFGIESTFGYTNNKLSQLYHSLNGQNEYHQRIEAIIASITQLRGYKDRPVIFVVQGDPVDAHLRLQFHEDKGVDSVSYIDFLCQIHKQIQNKLSQSDYQQTAAALLMANTY